MIHFLSFGILEFDPVSIQSWLLIHLWSMKIVPFLDNLSHFIRNRSIFLEFDPILGIDFWSIFGITYLDWFFDPFLEFAPFLILFSIFDVWKYNFDPFLIFGIIILIHFWKFTSVSLIHFLEFDPFLDFDSFYGLLYLFNCFTHYFVKKRDF